MSSTYIHGIARKLARGTVFRPDLGVSACYNLIQMAC